MIASNPAGAGLRPAERAQDMRWVRAFVGTRAQVAEVRRFVACLLEGCPASEALVTCASELSANAVVHTASGSGGIFTVEVSQPRHGVARIAVTDAGGPTEPAAGATVDAEPGEADFDDLPVCGLGLALVAATASDWGYHDAGPGRTVWAEACWPVPVPAGGGPGAAGETGAARRDFPEHAAPSRFSLVAQFFPSVPDGAVAGQAAHQPR
jgi:anti-sigma regulatory factor (Ser/Thr protein kinase)